MFLATSGGFPSNSRIKDASGLPWGVVAVPFMPNEEKNLESDENSDEGGDDDGVVWYDEQATRCGSCGGYAASICRATNYGWFCLLCSAACDGPSPRPAYGTDACAHDFPRIQVSAKNDSVGFLFLVDISGGIEFAELAHAAVSSCLDAVPPGSSVGIVAWDGTSMGAFDLRSSPTSTYLRFDATSIGKASAVALLRKSMIKVEGWNDAAGAALSCLAELAMGCENHAGDRADIPFDALSASVDALSVFSGGQLSLMLSSGAQVERLRDGDFRSLAARAAHEGVSADLFAISDEPAPSLLLVELTAGKVFMYRSVDVATLPRDLHAVTASRKAWGCMVRVRTSPEFRAVVADGLVHHPLIPCADHAGIWRMGSCSTGASVCFDLAFTSGSGFGSPDSAPPCTQLAISYWSSYLGEHRLRVITRRWDVTSSPASCCAI